MSGPGCCGADLGEVPGDRFGVAAEPFLFGGSVVCLVAERAGDVIEGGDQLLGGPSGPLGDELLAHAGCRARTGPAALGGGGAGVVTART